VKRHLSDLDAVTYFKSGRADIRT